MRELVHTDLPEPVVPAMSTWGSRAMSPTMSWLPMSRPTAKETAERCSLKVRDSITSRMITGETALGWGRCARRLPPGPGRCRRPGS